MKPVTSFGIAATFVGIMIGAGYASGQEVLQFFGGFGAIGLAGIVVMALFYGIYGAMILVLARRLQTSNYVALIVPGQNRVLKIVVDVLMAFLLFGMLSVMVAGASALLNEYLGLHPLVGGILMIALPVITVYWGSQGLVSALGVIVPIMILTLVVIAIISLINAPSIEIADPGENFPPNPMVGNWFASSLLMVLFSVLGSLGALPAIGLRVQKSGVVLRAAIYSGVTLGAIALVIYLAMMSNAAEVLGVSMPMVELATRISPTAGYIYVGILFLAIYTTAVGALFSIRERISLVPRMTPAKTGVATTVIAALSLIAVQIGFVGLVAVLYPLYGYMGAIIFVGILINLIWTRGRSAGGAGITGTAGGAGSAAVSSATDSRADAVTGHAAAPHA